MSMENSRHGAAEQSTGLEIAIVGMAGRFPGADNVDAFWQNLRDGVESVRTYTDDELRARGVPDDLIADPDYVKTAVTFEGSDQFDAAFFGYTPREAERLDPQHRVFLECAWEALESAGYDAAQWPGAIAVFGGAGANVYLLRHLLPGIRLGAHTGVADLLDLVGGNGAETLCTRVAYKLGLRGPAATVQTACSTSLMAVHMGCQSLIAGECDMALAGGVTLNLLQSSGYRYQPGAIFSPDGHCRAFDARAGGTLLGSGAGVVVLKRLEDALQDGDHIHAVIRATAANNDAADKIGFTAPSVNGQAAAIRAAHVLAGVPADSIGYVEAHGTGTTLGDPIEIAALTQAFRASTDKKGFCAIGSVKTNIGHLDCAAGVAALIKTALALEHRTLPASLHFEQPNPKIDFADSPFFVNAQTRPWDGAKQARRAGVSGFGIGGTNVHAVLEEAPELRRAAEDGASGWQVLPVSAASAPALQQAVERLASHLETNPGQTLADVAHTLQVGRRALPFRAAVAALDHGGAARALRQPGLARSKPAPDTAPEVVFLFPGAGSQHARMGAALHAAHPVFRETIDHCLEFARSELDLDLRPYIWPEGDEAEANARLAQVENSQPAIFVVSYAMAKLWESFGVRPSLMLGHSLGEYVAACLAGVFSLEDALRVVVARARLQSRMGAGAMTSVLLPAAQLQRFLGEGCDLAAVNGESLSVLAGPVPCIEQAEQILAGQGHVVRRLRTSVAFHSSMADSILGAFEDVVASVARHAPRIPFVSNVTGALITAEQATDPAYWVKHLRGTVRFLDGLDTLLAVPGRVVLEVGPGDVLASLARQHAQADQAAGIVASQAHSRLQEQNARQFSLAIGGLWSAGVEVDWRVLTSDRHPCRVPLPTYPFQRRSYWVPVGEREPKREREPLGRQAMEDWFYAPVWRRVEDTDERETSASGCSIVFVGSSAIADAVVERLKRRDNGAVVTVSLASAFTCVDAHRYDVRAAQKSDIAQVLQAVTNEVGPIVRIFHLWCLDEVDSTAIHEKGLMSVLALAQALGESARPDVRSDVSLTVVADGVADVMGGEHVRPERAALLGFCKVLEQELPFVRCHVVDVSAAWKDAADLARVAYQIDAEVRDESIVAYRGAFRWLRSYEPVARPLGRTPRLRKRGVYLITGGLGGVGMTFARHLAKQWQARLVLLTRTTLPRRGDWERIVASNDEDDELRNRLRFIVELEALGAEVLVVAADVTDAKSLHDAVRIADEHFGSINGAIHTAGRAGGALIALRERLDVEKVLAPKLQGTQHLLQALSGQQLDFALLCSALTAIVGGFGQADYSAANSAMDAIAARGMADFAWPVISVNWDVWRNTGMAVGQRLPDDLGIESDEGGELLERVLAGPPTSQILVSSVPLERQFSYAQSAELTERIEFAPSVRTGLEYPRPELDVEYVAPMDETEQALAAIWSDLLGIRPIGVKDNLFDLGGNSLLAVQILSRVRLTFRLDVPPSEFLRSLTIQDLAALVRGRGTKALNEVGEQTELVPALRTGVQRPSLMQQRVWLFDCLAGNNAQTRSAYNEPLAVSLQGVLDTPLLQQTLEGIVERHEILRTIYPQDDQGEPIAIVKLTARVPMPVVDLAHETEAVAREHYQTVYDEAVGTPFDIAGGPLLRAKLVRFAEDSHILIVVIHHIIFDGWSTSVFANELCEGYQALRQSRPARLSSLPVQYADYARWHEQRLALQGKSTTEFWRRQLVDAPLQSTIPYDHPRPKEMLYLGATNQFVLGLELSEKVRALARSLGVSSFPLLFGAFLLVLHRWLGRSDLVVGTDVAGRTHADLENLIGFFVNVLPVRSRLDVRSVAVRQWLLQLQTDISAIFDHQDLPFDQITNVAKLPRASGSSPLVQVIFVLQNTPQRRFELDGLAVDVMPRQIRSSKFDMAVFVFERGADFVIDWVYAAELYREGTIASLSNAWREALQSLCTEPNAMVGDVSIPTLSGNPIMKNPVVKANKLEKLASLGKKAPSSVQSDGAIRISFPSPSRQFPVLIEAIDRDLDPVWWASQQRAFIEDKLGTHAGIVFRNFGLKTPQDFERFTEAMEPKLYGSYGDLPKKEGGVNTYRSTPYPEKQMILYHNECSHTDCWPRKQWFFCELPSKVGGITPIVDCRELLAHLPAQIVEEMERKGLLYVRNFHPKLDVSWQHFFKTDDRGEVEQRLLRGGIEWVWLDGDILQTRTHGPAVITHPVTGARAFFNQVQLHHVSCLEPEVRDDLLGLVGPELMPRHVFFGDGSPIPEETMKIIGEGYEACAVRLDWLRGDVVMLDNMLAAHARDPYEEPRKIVVAMGSMYERDTNGQIRPVAA